MDQEEIQNGIRERFNNLQPEIQTAIMDTNYEKYLEEIIKKYDLSNDQAEELEYDTTLVMIGQINPDDEYKDQLSDDLNLSNDKINQIVNDVNEKILNPILNLLRKNFLEEEYINNTPSQNLTEEEQVAIENSDWKQVISRINQNYKLNILQGKILEDTTLRVINNSIHIDKYKDELINKISISPEEANSIAEEVKDKIFNKIKKLAQIEKVARADFEKVPEPEYNDIPLPPYVNNIENKKEEEPVKIKKPSYGERKQPDPYHEEI